MFEFSRLNITPRSAFSSRPHWMRLTVTILTLIVIVPAVAFAQSGGTPFDTGFTALQTLFTGTIAKVASLIAIVIGGYEFAHGSPGAKKPPKARRSPSGRSAGLPRSAQSGGAEVFHRANLRPHRKNTLIRRHSFEID
jgi:type IV secretion system protein VirB2